MARPRGQEDLNAWLDVQERKPFSRVDSIDEILEAFDPLCRRRGAADFTIPARILEIYDRGEQGTEGRGAGIRRTRKWCFEHDLVKPLVPQMMNKIKYAVQTRHKITYSYGFELRNVENGETMVYYTNTNSPWMEKLSLTKEWLTTQEELRLQGAKIDRPNTKRVFQRHMLVDLKVILDRQPTRTHTRSSMTSKLTKTRQRQATRHVISLMKVSMYLSQSLSLTR